MSENEESDRGTNGKVEVEWDTKGTMDISDGGLYLKVTVSSWKGCNPSSLQ